MEFRGLKPDSALRGRPKETLNQTSKLEVWILNWALHYAGTQEKTLNYKLLSKFQIRGCVARSRVSSSQILTTVEQILHYAEAPWRTLNQTSLEVPNSRPRGPKSGFQLPNLRFGTLKSSFCGALLRFLEVFEIHKLAPNLGLAGAKL